MMLIDNEDVCELQELRRRRPLRATAARAALSSADGRPDNSSSASCVRDSVRRKSKSVSLDFSHITIMLWWVFCRFPTVSVVLPGMSRCIH